MEIDPKSFAPVQAGEIEKLRKLAQDRNENVGLALDRTLNVLERTLNERDHQMQANIQLLSKNGKLHGILKNAHDLLEDLNCEFQYDHEDARPRHVWCPTCGEDATCPDKPVHKPNCLYVHVMAKLHEEVGYTASCPEDDAE